MDVPAHEVSRIDVSTGGFRLAELRFPPGYRESPHEPEAAYLTFVAEGAVEKHFGARGLTAAAGTLVTVPAGAAHGARFAERSTVALVVAPVVEGDFALPLGRLLGSVTALPAGQLDPVVRRIAVELRTHDEASSLVLEGLALTVCATALRVESARCWRSPCTRRSRAVSTC